MKPLSYIQLTNNPIVSSGFLFELFKMVLHGSASWRWNRICFFFSILLYSIMFSITLRFVIWLVMFNSLTISISKLRHVTSIMIKSDQTAITSLPEDNTQWKPYVSPYDVYRDNFSDFERILYVQRNYDVLDNPERNQKLKRVVSDLNTQMNRKNRHVIFQDMKETGLGNNLLAVASSFLVSRILNASYQVNWKMYHHAFDSPLEQFDTDLSYKSVDSTYSKWKVRWSGCSPPLHTLETVPIVNLINTTNLLITAYYDYSKHILKSRQYDTTMIQNGLVNTISHHNFPLISDERFSLLKYIYYSEFSLITAVQLFFRPKQFLQIQINSFLSSWRQFHLIGLQIRMGSGGADFSDSHRFLQMASVSRFVSAAEEYRIQRGYKSNQVKWFLSTDSTEVEKNLTMLFPGRVLVNEGYRRGHSSPEKANQNGFYRAVLDVSVLSQCEFIIVTNYSSFGMIARMIGRNPSFHIVAAKGY